MATLSHSSVVIPKGSVGNLVFYELNGKPVVRSKPASNPKNKYNPSPLQLIQREKLKTINAFLKPIKEALNFGYQEFVNDSKKGIHWAFADINTKGYNHTREQKIDPSYLRVSKGNLLGPENAKLTRNGNSLEFSWIDNSTEGKAQATDETFIVLYCPEEKKYIWPSVKFRRKTGMGAIELDTQHSTLSWHVYLAFSQLNLRKKKYILSDSVYLGRV
ncbi:DUF6266 family protein [Algoriphagus litoralis]|uniref:DUF6266 family protein n=1 Tax=Algoriphagus litoralis TaxID=2202829 RepID=UPI000DB97B8B|nr:DUF6266 family protein [Algoriphagus litoralis]